MTPPATNPAETHDHLPQGVLSSPAAARNTDPILGILKVHMPAQGRVLEIASGSGEHAVAFSRALPGLQWLPSDPSPEAQASIAARADRAGLANLAPPLGLDMLDPGSWPSDLSVDALVCINMIHISPWAATEGLMRLAGKVLRRPGGLLLVYGPFRETGAPLAPSNAAFDESLRQRNPAWGLRDLETVTAAAQTERLAFTRRVEMPANNLILVFRTV